MPPNEDNRARLLRRLAVVVDDRWTYQIRLSAVQAIQVSLPDGNPLRGENAEQLLDRALKPWDCRLYLQNGRGIMRRVSRPPISLRDVWL